MGRTSGIKTQFAPPPFRVVLDHRTRRLFVVRIVVTEEDLSERNAVPGIPLGWPTIAQNDGISVGDWLRQPVGEAKMLARDLVRVEPKIERQVAHDRDL